MDEVFLKFLENYSVSNLGRIRTDSTGRVWTPQDRDKRKLGYLSVHIKGKNYSIHRLVAEKFVENSDPKKFTIVNHKDNNPSNNVWTNLEWTDQKGNMRHCKIQGRHTCDKDPSFRKQVQEINKPSKVRRNKKNNLPIGVFELRLKNGIKYHARFANTTVGYTNLGTYPTAYDAYQAVKKKYLEVYGVLPPDADPEYLNPLEIKSGRHKLNEEQAREIKYSTLSIKELANLFKISESCVKDIKHGRTWKNI